MYYQTTITIPAETPKIDAIEYPIEMTKGTLKRILVGFPPGCSKLVHVQILDRTWPLCPATRGQDIAWDGFVFEFDHTYPITEEPYEVRVKAWNDDDSYEHTIFVGIDLKPGEVDESLYWLIEMMSLGA